MRKESSIAMGNESFCRICGQRHSAAIQHQVDDISEVQKVQMIMEELAIIFSGVRLRKGERKDLEIELEHLKVYLRILEEPIYLNGKIKRLKIPEANRVGNEETLSEDERGTLKEYLKKFQEEIENEAWMSEEEEKNITNFFEKTMKGLGME